MASLLCGRHKIARRTKVGGAIQSEGQISEKMSHLDIVQI
jgi:hypothetical protein